MKHGGSRRYWLMPKGGQIPVGPGKPNAEREAPYLKWIRKQRALYFAGIKAPKGVSLEEAMRLSKKGARQKQFAELRAMVSINNYASFGIPFEIKAGGKPLGLVMLVPDAKLLRNRIAKIAVALNQTLALIHNKSSDILRLIGPNNLPNLAPSQEPRQATRRDRLFMVLYTPLEMHRAGILFSFKPSRHENISELDAGRLLYRRCPEVFSTKVVLNDEGKALQNAGKLEIDPDKIITIKRK